MTLINVSFLFHILQRYKNIKIHLRDHVHEYNIKTILSFNFILYSLIFKGSSIENIFLFSLTFSFNFLSFIFFSCHLNIGK